MGFLKRPSLRVKATLLMLLVIICAQATTATISLFDANRRVVAEQQDAADSIAISLAQAAELSVAVGDQTEMTRLLQGAMRHGDAVFAAIIDPRERLLAHAERDKALFKDYVEHKNVSDRVLIGNHQVILSEENLEGVKKITQSQRRQIGQVVVGLSNNRMYAAQNAQAAVTLMSTLGAIVVCGAAVFLAVGTWTNRLGLLVGAAEVIAKGELGKPIDISREDEIGRLARSFENMRVSLAAREAERQEFYGTLQQQIAERTADLQQALHAAEAAARTKSEFLANMSHEIRTPMTAILGYAELLQTGELSPIDREDHIRTIRRNGDHLLGIINDILDLSKIEAGKMTVEHTRCSICNLVAEVAATMRVRAVGKGITLDVEYIFPVPETIDSDPFRIRQILVNLVGNALKFTDRGSVRLRVRSEALAQGFPLIAIEVIDTGIGISDEKIDGLFKVFSQADGSMTRKYGGTGLGLSISQRLAQLLGGSITVKSEPGKGSTFTVTLPTGSLDGVRLIADATEAVLPSPDGAEKKGAAKVPGKILLAEDGPDNQRLISFLLRKAGAEVTLAENGKVAIEAVQQAKDAGHPFDLILMDMQMPEMDGYQATQKLRADGEVLPIIALTAHAMSGDRDKCLAAGCDDYATKPVDRAKLLATCSQWLQTRRELVS